MFFPQTPYNEQMIKLFKAMSKLEIFGKAKRKIAKLPRVSVAICAMVGVMDVGAELVERYVQNDIFILDFLYTLSIVISAIFTAASCYLLCKVLFYKNQLVEIFDGNIPLVGILILTSHVGGEKYERNKIKIKDVHVDIYLEESENENKIYGRKKYDTHYTTEFKLTRKTEGAKLQYTVLHKLETETEKQPKLVIFDEKEKALGTIAPNNESQEIYRGRLAKYVFPLDKFGELGEGYKLSIGYVLESAFTEKSLQYFVIDPQNFTDYRVRDIKLSIRSKDENFNNHNIYIMEYYRTPFAPCRDGEYGKSGKQMTPVKENGMHQYNEIVTLSTMNTFLILRVQ